MSRVGPAVCELTDERFAAFARVWVNRRIELGHSAELARRVVTEGRLAQAALADDVVVFLACTDDEVVGFAWVADRPLSTLLDGAPVTVEDLYVVPDHRRRGVARVLLAAAATLASKNAGDQIACLAPTHSRYLNRALARLGFVPSTTCRVAPTVALVRRLRGADTPASRDNVLHLRRRTQRARQAADVAVAR